MINIAILASGSGSNAQKLMDHFQDHPEIKISLLASNKKDAFALQRAKDMNVDTHHFSNAELKDGSLQILLSNKHIHLIVLAGFLALIPQGLIEAFPEKIINIHPSLLPKYGGKGMYGMHVHQAVKEAKETYSGLTIHLVNEEFDKGKVLFQATVKIQEEDTAEDIASKVLNLEHRYFAQVVESYLCSL
jgi:phosphoribosylglycinamide formyltransferase-1